MNRLKTFRILLWAIVAIALLVIGYLALRQPAARQPEGSSAAASYGGPFTLVATDGQPFSNSKLAGKPYAIFFGFTHCPDVCPTTLQRLVKLRREIGKGADAFNIVFVSVDPERDTPPEMAKYAALFGDPVIALTGSPAQVEQVKKQYGIYSRKVANHHGGEGYGVEHTSTVLLFDRNGALSGTIALEEADAPALDKLKRITA